MDPRLVIADLLDGSSREFDVELWDGSVLPHHASRTTRGRLVLRGPRALAALLPPAAERRTARAFMKGDVEITGDTISVLESLARWKGPRLRARVLPSAASAWLQDVRTRYRPALRRPRHSIARDAQSVRRHYDLSDDFYRLFLDSRMVYSCAFFPRGDESIDEAQEVKLELACRKLDLRPHDRLLDLGCGWGGLLVYAATHFDISATGTTVSHNQWHEARRRAIAASVDDRVRVLECDYRRLPQQDKFDKAVSIGMMEHVGSAHLDDYFARAFARLRPGGLFLNHAVADIADGERMMTWLHRTSGGFIERDIFPDSELPSIGAVIAAAERQGFEVRDVECTREHYAQTLQLWLSRLEQRFDEAVVLVGARTARAWRLYLAMSAVAFRAGYLGVYQTLLARRTGEGQAEGLPRSRRVWTETPAPSVQTART